MGCNFDYIIIGAGSAGCVLAHRLSERADRRVLLIEAGGRDWHPFIHMPAGLAKLVDARFIAILDTAIESPLGQIAMVPMLAWIARNAPPHLKATFFAVMASFTNLALSASSLGTRYMNEIFTVTRERFESPVKVSDCVERSLNVSEPPPV